MGAAPKKKERGHPRHLVEIRAKVRPVGATYFVDGHLINLSKGGTCIESTMHFFPGQMLEILVPAAPSAGKDHRILATVIWRRENHHGVSFVA